MLQTRGNLPTLANSLTPVKGSGCAGAGMGAGGPPEVDLLVGREGAECLQGLTEQDSGTQAQRRLGDRPVVAGLHPGAALSP